MLQRSFVHLPGIGASKEKMLWGRGVHSWQQLLGDLEGHIRGTRLDEIRQLLCDSQSAWERRDAFFFYQQLPRQELWRLVPEFLDDIAYLDIETNGLNLPPHSQSTTVTFYFRGQLYQEWKHDAKASLIRKMDAEASVFCTYFGEVFDVPFLRREFGLLAHAYNLELQQRPHLGLAPIAYRPAPRLATRVADEVYGWLT